MAIPRSREEFKEFCLRKLGKPVIEINVDDDQVEDRIDEAIKYWNDYHFDGSEKVYLKHRVTQNNFPDSVYSLTLVNGGSGYSNTDTLVFTAPQGEGAAGTITTDSNGTIISVELTNNGTGYPIAPTVTVDTSTGSGAEITCELGGFIEVPDNIIGAINIFDLASAMASRNMFSIQYQIALNDLYTLTSYSMIPYYMTFTHLNLIQQLLVGQQPIRYNRHRNRLYIDMNWYRMAIDEWLIIEAYEVVDPDKYTDMWGDRWLQKYATALIKRQWGSNLTKFTGMQLPGGVMFNGEKIYNDAVEEINKLEEEMVYTYSLPSGMMIG